MQKTFFFIAKIILKRSEAFSFRCVSFPILLLMCIFSCSISSYAKPFPAYVSPADSVSTDSIKIASPKKDTLDSPIKYNAVDSFRFDIENKKIYLFGNAEVDYKDIVLTADYIEFDWGNSVVTAIGTTDSSGKIIGKPHFKQGDDDYESNKIMYNFRTKKGKILDLITEEGDGYVQVEQAKKDSNDAMYAKNAIYSTCDLAKPHFYIKASKVQIIKDKVIVSGPANLVIEDIPTPLFVPFAIFPIKKGRTSGIIFPEYGEDRELGFFLKNGGYYFAVNDNFDLALRGDIYSRGSWRANVTTDYAKRYKYSGAFSLSYAQTRTISSTDYNPLVQKDFKVDWTFNQQTKARPNTRFAISVQAGTSHYNKLYSYSYGNYLNNTYNSSISFHQNFKGTPFHLDLLLGHSQNINNHTIDFNLPTGSITMDRINPFKRKIQIGDARWYEKISFNYRADFVNSLSTKDNLLFTQENILGQCKNGFHQSIPLSTTFRVFKYINISPSLNYDGYFYLKTIRKSWDSVAEKMDTTFVNGFRDAEILNGNISMNTTIYATYSFNKGKLLAIRHVLTPSITANFHPDYGSAKYGYYYFVKADTDGDIQPYSIFDNSVYRILGPGKSGTILFSLDNNIEAKVFSKKDTITHTKKIPLLDGIGITGGYNFAVDTLNIQPIHISARENILNRFSLNAAADFSAYQQNKGGYPINKLMLDENKLARLAKANFSATTSFGSKQKKYNSTDATKQEIDMINKNPDAYVDFNVPWKFNVGYNLNYRPKNPLNGDTPIFTQTLRFDGELNLTDKWKINFQTNYDFKLNKFAYTTVEIYRDLHCWEMSFRWVPFGAHQSYSFDLNVKSSVLQSLKISKRKSWNEYY